MSTTASNYVPCGCKAHLDPKDPRASIWKHSLGCLEFPLKHPISHMGKAQGESAAKFLEGDWDALSADQKTRMCKKLRKKFGIDRAAFEYQIKALGYMPIKDENVSVVICQKHSRMMM